MWYISESIQESGVRSRKSEAGMSAVSCQLSAHSVACLLASVFFLLSVLVHAQTEINLAALKKDAQIFEGIINDILKQNFKNPFALTLEPKGAYVRGHGAVFFFHLNINRGRIRTPFGEVADPSAGPERSKEEQIRLVRDLMIQCLANYGPTIQPLNGHDRITITAHIEDRSEFDPTKSTTVMVLSVLKDDVDAVALKRVTMEKFREKVQVVQY